MQVHLLCETTSCGASLLEAADNHQDWSAFLTGLFGDFSGAPSPLPPHQTIRPGLSFGGQGQEAGGGSGLCNGEHSLASIILLDIHQAGCMLCNAEQGGHLCCFMHADVHARTATLPYHHAQSWQVRIPCQHGELPSG